MLSVTGMQIPARKRWSVKDLKRGKAAKRHRQTRIRTRTMKVLGLGLSDVQL